MIQKMAPDPNNPLQYVPQFNEDGSPVMIHGRRKIGAWGRNGVKITFRFSL